MEIILLTLLGALAGYIVSITTQSSIRHSPIYNILLGIIGAIDSGSLLNLIGVKNQDTYSLVSIIVVFVGSISLIRLAKLMKKI